LFEKRGTTKRRAWRKLHIGVDAGSGENVAFDLTGKDVDDASHVPTPMDQPTRDPVSFMAMAPTTGPRHMMLSSPEIRPPGSSSTLQGGHARTDSGHLSNTA
jgi:hypothetical protein